jgi:hypothetical protein
MGTGLALLSLQISKTMKTLKIVAALILVLFASAAMAKTTPVTRNLNLVERVVNAGTTQATSFDSHTISKEKLLTTRKKLVYFLESDPMSRRPAFDLSGGKPKLNIC